MKKGKHQKPAPKPPPPAAQFSAEIEAKLATFPAVKQKNLRITLAKYERGQTSQWEERKLAEAGLIDTPLNLLSALPASDTCYTQESLAARLTRHYQHPDGTSRLKIGITKRVVSEWCKGHGLGKNQVEAPGPIAGTKARYSFSAWTTWFDQNLLAEKLKPAAPPATAPATAAVSETDDDDEDFTVMEQREKRDAIKHRRWEREKERGEWIHWSVAKATGIAAIKRLHLLLKQEDERGQPKLRREKLLALGVAPELVELFSTWDQEQTRQATDRREVAMQEAAAGLEIPTTTN